jgi:hypothetical protein
MALQPETVKALLQAKQQDFQVFDQSAAMLWRSYQQALQTWSQVSSDELLDTIRDRAELAALPLEPFQACPNWVMPAHLAWESREQSLEWVRQHLTGVSTFAVDGSQIYPSKDFSIPVALVQTGSFENRHASQGEYHKAISVDLLTPKDLRINNSGEPAERQVNVRRFQLETEQLVAYLKREAGSESALAFFDGALVASFANAFDPETRQLYVQCIVALLQASETYQVPLIGYVDTTYARDLTVFLQQLGNLSVAAQVHDAQLLAQCMTWGDRTPMFQCQRDGILEDYGDQGNQIVFTYLKANADYPVRIELPRWVYESGRYEQVLNWVRGEVIIGGGYPYVIEAADQTAVLQAGDRQVFYRILQDWAASQHLHLRLSRKMVSKARRR